MDARKAFGVEQALGKALAADASALERLRALPDKAAFASWLDALELRLPRALVDDYLATVPEGDWPKARAKLVLAVKLAQGAIRGGQGHAAGRGVRKD